LFVSIRTRERRRDVTGNPWDGRTLEWSTASPPPVFNFAVYPNVAGQEPYSSTMQSVQSGEDPKYEAIEIPRNTATGFVTAFFAVVTGFAMIWHMWWLVVVGLIGAYATFVVFAWRDISETTIPAEEVAQIDRANRAARAAAARQAHAVWGNGGRTA
jgi:cytochrome o ubiquinol oxidase subunit 1